MLDQRPDFRLLAIVSKLVFRKRRASVAFFAHLIFDIQVLQNMLDLLSRIGTVCVQGFSSISLVHKFLQGKTFMRAGCCDSIVSDQGSARILFDVVFVTVKTHSVIFYPPSIGILVAAFVFIPIHRNISGFDLGIFLPSIVLLGNFNDCGIDDRSGLWKNSLGLQLGSEVLEELTLQSFLCQGLPESPKARVIGDRLPDMKPEKAGKGKPVGDLILQLLVAEIEQALNNQGLEHQNHIQRLAPCRTFPIRFAQSLSQNRTKHLEINPLGQLLQRVIQTTQCGNTLTFIKKGNLV
jgi:hypothetical protein